MHLLHRPSMFSGGGGGGGGRALRRVGSSPRAPPPPTRHSTLSRSDSIKKKSGTAERSKRARLRAGLAAALQELRLAGRKQHGARGRGAGAAAAADVVSAGAARPRASDDVDGGGCCVAGAAAPLHVSAGAEVQASRGVGVAGGRRVKNAAGGWPLLLVVVVLALACVVALGRAPAVCCCTCAAWLCRGQQPLCGSASSGGRHRSSEPSAAAPFCHISVRCLRD